MNMSTKSNPCLENAGECMSIRGPDELAYIAIPFGGKNLVTLFL